MRSTNSKSAWVLALGAILATTAYLFWPMVRGALITGDLVFFEWDVPEQYWPDLVYLCESLHDGELPYWNPYDRGGYPYYADPQAAAYHPLNWAICAVAGPSPSLDWAEARVLLGFVFSGVFGLLWLRRLGFSIAAATFGAVVLETAPFMRHNWELNLTTAMGFLPLMLWAGDRVVVERSARDGALLGLSLGSCAWIGSPPALWFAITFLAAYMVARATAEFFVRGFSITRRLAIALAVSAAFAVGFLAVVLAPGGVLTQYSIQAGRSYESISEGSLPIDYLAALVSPRPGNHLFMGLVPLALGVAALGMRQHLRLAMFMLAMGTAAVLLALGDNGPLFPIAFHVPGFNIFRAPHRYEAWLGPVAASLGAAGIDAIARLQTRKLSSGWHRWLRLDRAHWVLALLLFHVVDVTRAIPEDRHMRIGAHPGGSELAAAVLKEAPNTQHDYRYMDEFGVSCRSGTRFRHRDFRGYQDPLQLRSYERVVGSLRDAPGLAPQFNVRYALTGPHFIHGWNRHYLPPPDELESRFATEASERGVVPIDSALPFAYWVPSTRVERFSDRAAALSRLMEIAPARVALLDDTAAAMRVPATPTAAQQSDADAVDVRVEPDRVQFRIDAPSAGLVIVNESWFPGWRAWIDGDEAPVIRANSLVRAIPISAGHHAVEMRFQPVVGRVTRWMLVASWALFLTLLVVRRYRSR